MKSKGYFLNNEINSTTFLDTNSKKVVLAVGQVQAGKTQFIINTVKEALLDNDYDCALILGGVNNILLEQTEKRFENDNDFKKYNIGYYNISKDNLYMCKIPNKKFIISCLKGDDAIDKVKSFLKLDISNRKIIVVDDESDFATPFTQNSENSVHNKLREIYNNMVNGIFISVTATPFADLSLDNSFEHTELVKINPHNGYTGLKFFNSNESIYQPMDETLWSNFIHRIKQGDSKKSIFTEFILDHVKRLYNSGLEKSQMIINISNGVDDHKTILNSLENAIKYIKGKGIINLGYKYESDNEKHIVPEILKQLEKNIIILNGDKKKIYQNDNWINCHSIIIGGYIISRGYTFENLITIIFYYDVDGKYNADTLLQKCRWFGYRSANEKRNINLYNFMKVHILSKTINSLKECELLIDVLENNDDIEIMKNKISNCKLNNLNITGKK